MRYPVTTQRKTRHRKYSIDESKDDEIDLIEIFRVVWKGKWVIILSTFLFTLGAFFYAKSLPNIYQANAVLTATELDETPRLASNLTAITGISFNFTQNSNASLAVEVMKSRRFLSAFIKENNLIVPIGAAIGWDKKNNKLILSENLYNAKEDKWLRDSTEYITSEPTEQELYAKFVNNMLSINHQADSNIYTVSIKFYSPILAAKWANAIVHDINIEMRNRAIEETKKNLAYLEAQLKRTAVTAMQNSFYSIIEDQTKTLMLAEAQDEFVFKVLDPAVVPEVKAAPKRALMIILGAMLGMMLGTVLVLIFSAVKNREI